jgi:hypothetical protein
MEMKETSGHALHSTGSEITSLTSGIKKNNHVRDLLYSLGYPVGVQTPTFEDNQGTIKSIRASRIQDNTCYLATKMLWLNEQHTAGIIKLLYTKMTLQLSDISTKPLCGKYLQVMISYLVGVRFYPAKDTRHFQSLFLDFFQLLTD